MVLQTPPVMNEEGLNIPLNLWTSVTKIKVGQDLATKGGSIKYLDVIKEHPDLNQIVNDQNLKLTI